MYACSWDMLGCLKDKRVNSALIHRQRIQEKKQSGIARTQLRYRTEKSEDRILLKSAGIARYFVERQNSNHRHFI